MRDSLGRLVRRRRTRGRGSWPRSARKFHFRLPFFARARREDKVRINGNAAPGVIEKEIAYAASAGLNYWAFVDYGDKGDLTIARRRYQAVRDKRGLRFRFIEEGSRIDGQGTRGWARLISFFQDPNYQTVLEGRPLLFLFGVPKKVAKKEFQELGDAAVAAGGKRPYLVALGFDPRQDAKDMEALGCHAVSAYAAGGQYRRDMWSYAQLTEHVWGRVPLGSLPARRFPTITFATAGWDARPRLEHPVSWMPAWRPDPIPRRRRSKSRCWTTSRPRRRNGPASPGLAGMDAEQPCLEPGQRDHHLRLE